MKIVEKVTPLPGSPKAQESVFEDLLEKVRAGQIVYITGLAITKTGNYVRCDSGVASILEKVGLLTYAQHRLLDRDIKGDE